VATTDLFNVTITLDKASYTAGSTITATLSGTDVQTAVATTTVGPLTGQAVAADGATSPVTVPAFTINSTVATNESVKIASITDPSGRVWTVGANGLTATAIA